MDAHIKQVLYSEVSLHTSDCWGKSSDFRLLQGLQIISLTMSAFKLHFTPVQYRHFIGSHHSINFPLKFLLIVHKTQWFGPQYSKMPLDQNSKAFVFTQAAIQQLITHPFSFCYPIQGHGGLEPIPADIGYFKPSQVFMCLSLSTLSLCINK